MFDTVQETVDRLSATLGRSVVLDDAELVLLASSAHADDVDPARLVTLTTRRPSPELEAALRARRLGAQLVPRVIPAEPSLGLEHARLCLPLRTRFGVLGYLWVTLRSPLTPDRAATIAEAAETLRHLLVNVSQSIAAVNAEVESEMVGLLAPDAASRALAASELEDLGMYTRSSRFVALCVTLGSTWSPWDGPPPREVVSRILLRAVTTPMIDAYGFVPAMPDTFLLVGFRNRPTRLALDDMVGAILREVDAAELGPGAAVGVGAPVERLADAWESYEQALVALRTARARGTRAASWTEDALEASVVTLLATAPPAHLLPEPLRRLAAAEPGTLELFDVYFASGERAAETAQRLGVHRATVYSRLQRAAAGIGIDFDDEDARFIIRAWLRQRRIG